LDGDGAFWAGLTGAFGSLATTWASAGVWGGKLRRPVQHRHVAAGSGGPSANSGLRLLGHGGTRTRPGAGRHGAKRLAIVAAHPKGGAGNPSAKYAAIGNKTGAAVQGNWPLWDDGPPAWWRLQGGGRANGRRAVCGPRATQRVTSPVA